VPDQDRGARIDRGLLARGCRYGHTGALADLETAIACYEQAVLLAPADSPDLPEFLSNLFLALGNRYDHTGARADLEAAIAIYRRARALGHGVTPEVAMRAAALGVGEP
jgi:cytochrome c peroxidase